jgi:hypothetical protein
LEQIEEIFKSLQAMVIHDVKPSELFSQGSNALWFVLPSFLLPLPPVCSPFFSSLLPFSHLRNVLMRKYISSVLGIVETLQKGEIVIIQDGLTEGAPPAGEEKKGMQKGKVEGEEGRDSINLFR